jgi:hypothetical protein
MQFKFLNSLKDNIFLRTTRRHKTHNTKAQKAVKLWLRIFLSSTPDEGKKSDSLFTRGESAHRTHPTGSWFGPMGNLPNLTQRKTSCPCQESKALAVLFIP